MKRTLLTGTALATAAMLATSLASTPASAEIKISAFVDFIASWADDDDKRDNLSVGHAFATNSEVHFKGSAKTDAGLEYGFTIEMEGSSDDNDDNPDSTGDAAGRIDETSMYLKGAFGKVTLGLNDNASDKEIDGLVYGVYGMQDDYGDGSVGNNVRTGSAMNEPQISNDGSDAGMILYESPRFGGVQAAISYMPADGGVGGLEHLWGFNLNTSHKFEGVGIKLNATGVQADYSGETTLKEAKLSGYNLGLALDWEGFKLETGYARVHAGNWANGGTGDDDEGWSIGVGYGQGPWTVAVNYTSTEEHNTRDELEEWSFGAKYTIAKGLYVSAALAVGDTTVGGSVSGSAGSPVTTDWVIGTAVLGMSF